jgi:hypothetical protein
MFVKITGWYLSETHDGLVDPDVSEERREQPKAKARPKLSPEDRMMAKQSRLSAPRRP